MPSDNSEKMECPACGAPILITDQNCMECGARLDEGQLVGEKAPEPKAAGQEKKKQRPQPQPPEQKKEKQVPRPQPSQPSDTQRQRSETASRSSSSSSSAPSPSSEAASPPDTPEAAAAASTGYATASVGWRPGRMSAGGGFFDSLSRGWRFLTESIKMMFRDKDLIIPSVLAIIANLVWVGLGLLVLHATGQLEPFLSEEETASRLTYAFVLLLSFGSYAIVYVFGGMTCHLVDVHLKGRDAKLSEAFADAMQNIGALLILALITTIVSIIASIVRGDSDSSNFLRRAAGDLIEKTWQVASYLMLPLIMLEDISFSKSFSRARELHESGLMDVIVGALGVTIVANIIGFVFGLLGVGVGFLLFSSSPSLIYVAIPVALMTIAIGAAFTTYIRTAYYTCLYLWAAARETQGEQVAAPAPLEPALA